MLLVSHPYHPLKQKRTELTPYFNLQNCRTQNPCLLSIICRPQMDSSSPKPSQFSLQQTISKLQNQFSSIFNNLHNHRQNILNPNKFNFEFTLDDDDKKQTNSLSFTKNPLWARITSDNTLMAAAPPPSSTGLTNEDIEKRLAGVPVYALSNSSEEFVIVSGQDPDKSLGLLCFKEQDAQTLLGQMKSMDPRMRPGSKVIPVALSMVFQLKVDGVSFRLIPDSSEIKNAIEERRKAGVAEESFSGIPVFQSRSLVLRSQNKRYRPAFFRKEDLEKSLAKASLLQKHLNPALRVGNLEVAVLEDIIHGMKDNSTTVWDDVVFIPPGFDVSTDSARN